MKQESTHEGKERPHYCDFEGLGASFRELGVDVIPGETTDFVSRWFRSSQSDADLMIWSDGEKRIIKQQISFFGQVVEWNAIHGTRTGLIIETEHEPQIENDERSHNLKSPEVSETVRFDEKAQRESVVQAIRILASVSTLNETEKDKLIFNLRESPKMHKNTRERALKVWSTKGEEIVMESRPSFFKRLSRWFLGT